MPNIYIIGGPKDAGKTTVFLRLLPNFLECFEYVNADAPPECPIQSRVSRHPRRTLNDTQTAKFIILWHRFRLRDNFSRS